MAHIGTTRLAIDGGPPVRHDRLPLQRPWMGEAEVAAAVDCLSQGTIGGDGPRGRELERRLEQALGVRRALLVNSCTSALEMAMMIADVGPGDEVIMPSYTFVSAANAVMRMGAFPVFADIDAHTFNLDPATVARAVTPRTRVVMPVHYAGMACAMKEINDIAERHGLLVVEDAAHAIHASYLGRPLGTWSALGCFSFHETKDVVCGEGGILVVRDNTGFAHRAEVIREKGTDRSAFLRGERDKYSWIAVGGSYVLSDLLAAIALAQYRKVDEIVRRKTEHARFYLERLAPFADRLQLPVVPEGCQPNWHIFAALVHPARRDWILSLLHS